MPSMSFFIDVRSCSCCWEFSANHFTRSSMLERNNFSRWEIEHFLKSLSNDTDQTFLQKNQIAGNDDHSSQNKKHGRWKLPEIVSFFVLCGIQAIQILKLRFWNQFFFSGPHQLDFSVLFPCHFSNSIRIWQPKNMFSFKVVDPAQLKKIRSKKRSFVNLDHHQPSEI